MGRASRGRAAARVNQTTHAAGPVIRTPLPPDHPALARLLSAVVPESEGPGVDASAVAMATLPIPAARRDEYARGGIWVADQDGVVSGLVVATPPLKWIKSVPSLPHEERLLLSRRVIECEYLSVAPAWRGRGTGAALIAHARRQFTARGFRLMTATVVENNFGLLPYLPVDGLEHPEARRAAGHHLLRVRHGTGTPDRSPRSADVDAAPTCGVTSP
ncbi:GNAT family N-acetyltransferase [Streptomyces sp. NBC_01187]|uniref:GNAT family N-acetyltransferase n=1 Tax=Streptomyces sp. NBC_01187 TaxID=2903766 RepID=UPI002F90BAB2|nr:GNAT family N-acetyltransferase [Streptomyces sp. NBC_01187]